MASQWSDWIDHDGKGCPLPVGTICERKFWGFAILSMVPGRPHARYHIAPITATEGDSWNGNPDAAQVIRYRYQRPQALIGLIRLAEAPKPVRKREAA